jgi:hypothetical protein
MAPALFVTPSPTAPNDVIEQLVALAIDEPNRKRSAAMKTCEASCRWVVKWWCGTHVSDCDWPDNGKLISGDAENNLRRSRGDFINLSF